ncbi:hypothetical protein [Thalassospira australica]|uniref:hypothetical protein n=1 Tax=Thalassospira australica TaxID=1528106 RepID=UPI00384C97FA
MLKSVIVAGGALGAAMVMMAGAASAAPQVIEITQVPCQFLEPEGTNHHYTSTKKADCVAINNESGDQRVEKAGEMTLAPGDYIFRVANDGVPYEVGFWLRDKDYDWTDKILSQKISVSGGGLLQGKTKDYAVTLEPGEYLYSCPLNTTPNYKLVVK